jgi:hypothetical protein
MTACTSGVVVLHLDTCHPMVTFGKPIPLKLWGTSPRHEAVEWPCLRANKCQGLSTYFLSLHLGNCIHLDEGQYLFENSEMYSFDTLSEVRCFLKKFGETTCRAKGSWIVVTLRQAKKCHYRYLLSLFTFVKLRITTGRNWVSWVGIVSTCVPFVTGLCPGSQLLL